MWIGYVFDAGEFAFLWIYLEYKNDIRIYYHNDFWKYISYGYCGFLLLVALFMTVVFIQCIIGVDLRRPRAIPFCMAYFKLTSAVNAGFVFFNIWRNCRSVDGIIISVVTGLDTFVDLIEMGLVFVGLNSEKIEKRQVEVHPVVEVSPPKKKKKI